jgi:serine/threonine protein kinase
LEDVNSVSWSTSKRKEQCLKVTTPRRIYYLVPENHESGEEWKKAIEYQSDVVQGKLVETEKGPNTEKVNVGSFDFLTVIGQGSFGKVLQVRHKGTGDIYAMKILNKVNIVDRGEVEHTRAEKNILMKVTHPFLIKLFYSFQDDQNLYLVMDFINGGELFFHLQNERQFSNERACFYTAEICLAIAHLHSCGIIYRDLKPENLLIDSAGHIKVTDFGLSKEGIKDNARTRTFCGTPEYLAPEVLEAREYTKAVDWWSVGTLIFEMLTGLPPFYCEDVQKMYSLKMKADLTIPEFIEPEAADIIRKFLDKNPETRLTDIESIKKHVWFKDINWGKLYRKEIEPPYLPQVDKESTILIDEAFTKLDVNETISTSPNTSGGIASKGDQFEGFTYIPKKKT